MPIFTRCATALALFAASTCSPAMDTDALQRSVEARLDGDRTGACMVVAVVDDAVRRASACADPKRAARFDPGAAFEIGSISKTLTALLLAREIEAGRLSLDTPLAELLPADAKVPSFEGQPIRLRHVVTHTSGLPALPSAMPVRGLDDPYAAVDADVLRASLAEDRLDAPPGTRRAYSNYAMMLLSWGLARHAGSDFETLLRTQVLEPLGMRNSWIARRREGIATATGHTSNGKATPPWTFGVDFAGAGGVHATLDDLVAYARAQLGRAPSTLDASIALTQKPIALPAGDEFAMNWTFARVGERRVLAHEGGTGGFSALMLVDREGGRAVVVLADTALTSLGGLGRFGAHLLDPRFPAEPARRRANAPPELLDAMVGEYRLANGLGMRVWRAGSRLKVQPEGQAAFLLDYDSAGDFHPRRFDALLTPRRDGDRVDGFRWSQMGAVTPASRVHAAAAAAPQPGAASLAEYVGEYPLAPQFVLSVGLDRGRLYVQATGQQRLPLEAAGADRFAVRQVGAELRFERAEGRIVAVVLRQGGVDQRAARR
jgi:D-alanyl-D-alanine-carboxypeptidase/D-alanyl-D-alanine-endopeptidase